MAKKRGTSRKITKPKGAPPRKTTTAAKADRARPPAARSAPASGRSAPATRSLAERAERLRDDIQRSKTTHPDPWSYTDKARAWAQRAQTLLEEISRSGESEARRRALEALTSEVEADRDFREARRLF